MKKFFTPLFLFVFLFNINSQEIKKTEPDVFIPGWRAGANIGLNIFLAEGNKFYQTSKPFVVTFDDNVGFGERIELAYDFTSFFGLRGFLGDSQHYWPDIRYKNPDGSFQIVSLGSETLTVDMMLNLSNGLGGYRPHRFFNFLLFGGGGLEHRDEGNFTSDYYTPVIRAGFQGDFRLSSTINLNLIGDGNLVGDKFNNYVSQTPFDLYAALSVGVTFHFGGKHKQETTTNINEKLEPKKEDKTNAVNTVPGNLIQEKSDSAGLNDSKQNSVKTTVEPVSETGNDQTDVTVIVPKSRKVQPTAKKQNSVSYKATHKSTGRIPEFKVNIFYPFDETKIDEDKQREAIAEVVDFLNQYPDARIIVRGYADKGTGTHQFNYTLSNYRAENVTTILVNKYKIDPERIMTRAVGGSYQPFKQENMNRLVIISSVTKNNR